MAIAAVLVAVVSLPIFGPALSHVTDVLALQQHFNWVVISVPAFVGHYLGFGTLTQGDKHLLLGIFAATVVALLVRSRAGRGWLEAAAAATLALLVTTGWLLPWYIVWVLPLAALLRRRVVPGAAIALTLLLLAMQMDHYWLTRHSHHRHHLAVHAARTHAGAARRR